MMRKFKYFGMVALLWGCLTTLTSCEPEDWYYHEWWEEISWENDRRIEDALMGSWDLKYAEEDYGECPYRYNDEFYFGRDGRFEVWGSQDFYEQGRWYVERGRVVVHFKNPMDPDMVGKIVDLSSYTVKLDIKDYDANARYYLELRR